MPRSLPRYVLAERTRHGKVVFYFRRGKGPRTRLPAITDPDFPEAYARCLAGGPRRPAEAPSGSLAWLVARYRESARWAALKPSTRRMRENVLRQVLVSAGDVPFRAITRRHINEGIERRKPHAGNTFRKVMSQIYHNI